MAKMKALANQTELTRYMKAWKNVWHSEPRLEVRLDGTVVLSPSDTFGGRETAMTALEKRRARHAALSS